MVLFIIEAEETRQLRQIIGWRDGKFPMLEIGGIVPDEG
jgi:hypothetical protein